MLFEMATFICFLGSEVEIRIQGGSVDYLIVDYADAYFES